MDTHEDRIRKSRDTGLALVLALLILLYFTHRIILLLPAIGTLLIAMTVPAVFAPLARLWFGLSHVMGTIASTVILSALYFFLVAPIGMFRRIFGADTMNMSKWKSSDESTLTVRDHLYTKADMEKPY